MGTRRVILTVLGFVGALVIQTTLFGRVRIGGIAPDVVILAVVVFALRARAEMAMLAAFTIGFLFDAVASTSALGLRAMAYTTVAFVAVRTRDRADLGPLAVAVWAGLMTLVGVAMIFLVGTLFGQITMGFGQVLRRLLLIPLFNAGIAVLLSPLTSRMLDGRRGVMGL
ncbi:MAG: rod shape-determining protein MreD [Acidimicrobiia bacterium]|nr:rod shape-determining protein MreD [Acidimicrobiia bacterium]